MEKREDCLIVVIEYDDDVRESICDLLQMEGYDTLAFAHSTAALEALRWVKRNCLVVLELGAPLLDGWDFLLRKDQYGEAARDAPVFAFSSCREDISVPSSVQWLFPKPFHCDALLSAIRMEETNRVVRLNQRYA